MTDQPVTIENQQRFSQSILWELQRDYFDKEGINAWVKQVPFYVTSNPFIANCYANIAVSFVKDWLRLHPESVEHPFYFMELGTGSGMFSFYVMKTIHELCQQLNLHEVKIVYVMTDFTQNNLVYWQDHPALQYYLDNGLLDFAIFNLENDDEIKLTQSDKILSKKELANPLMICGNYIFDTVSHDAFSVENGDIKESLVTLKTNHANMQDGKPLEWDEVDITHHTKACDLANYYDDSIFNQVLQSYQGRLKNTNFLIPIAGLRTIRKLARDCDGKMLLISSDKAYSHIDELEGLNHPSLAFHGSFSMMVNYDAIAQYFKFQDGDVIMQSHRKGLKTNVFTLGAHFSELPETKRAIERHVQGVGPSDYFVYHRHISDSYTNLQADILASHMNFACWDPYMFHRLSPRINEVLGQADAATRQYLTDGMAKIEANYYYMPASHDTMFDIGIFFHTTKDYRTALNFYEKSEQLFGEQFNLFFNKALCKYYLGESAQALALFKQALILDPNSEQVKEWITFVETEDTKRM
ncbi:MAG: tetratricopeptide repeat protein [Coxiellaceae bacterium]|nr:tetratricopeptide repeat protein [Coxiellaceae bacterium]